ncbi:hypothetical protein AGMMS50239_40500 [Bacteroidia bacterium]|nr:hypothetical protein AGMMS50239_40500 [Bacteroidia bacterium]
MAKIKIRNIGPIVDVEMELNRVNVIMGPQSCGKSTIAKIISYFTWVEKDVATSQSLENYQKKNYFKEHLETFHKLKGYFKKNSFISYKSDVIELTYDGENFSISWVDRYAYERSKISYIPAERNLITLPEIEKVEFSHSNIRSFLFDWFDARKNYLSDKKLSILNLGVDYYYNEESRENHIFRKGDNENYDILLSNASSGLQSITPLIVTIDYLTNWIYNQEEKISVIRKFKEQGTDHVLLIEKVLKPYFGDNIELTNGKINEYINTVNKNIDSRVDSNLTLLVDNYYNLKDNLFSTHNTQFIIEEPEQNLFPETQRDLIYYLLEKLQSEREHSLTITTHSPYILYALNNCMLGGLVYSQLDGTEKEKYLSNYFKSNKSWINPRFVSVWEIENGLIRRIQDKDNIISKNYFDIKMTELTNEYYQILNYYQNEE